MQVDVASGGPGFECGTVTHTVHTLSQPHTLLSPDCLSMGRWLVQVVQANMCACRSWGEGWKQ